MSAPESRPLRVGHTIEDWCRPCKSFRAHTVMVVSGDTEPLRVTCDTCGSRHNFRGHAPNVRTTPASSEVKSASAAIPNEERTHPPMGDFIKDADQGELERLLRRIIRGPNPAEKRRHRKIREKTDDEFAHPRKPASASRVILVKLRSQVNTLL